MRGSALLVAGLCLTACSERGAGPVDWHVSEYSGLERSWQPEATFEAVSPSPPHMTIYEVTRYPDMSPTPEQRLAAQDLVERSTEASRRNGWFDYQKGLDDGFSLIFRDKTHYAKAEHFFDDRVLDPERPEVLMYYNTARGRKLAGAMYYVGSRHDRGPQLGGPLTVWHYHRWWKTRPCLVKGLLPVGLPDADGRCVRGTPEAKSPEMIHVWLIEHPQGRFSSNMNIPMSLFVELISAREERMAERGRR